MTTLDTSDSVLLIKRDDALVTLTINRPAARNAMNIDVLQRLPHVLEQLADDDAVRVVVITGAGDQAFCAGGDISGLDHQSSGRSAELVEQLDQWAQASVLLHEMPKPTIAVLNGVAAGAGMALALSCDLRVAARSASMLSAFARLAMPGDFGGSYFLTQLVGSAKARELYFLSERISSDEALSLGLVNRVVSDTELVSAVEQLVQQLLRSPPGMYRAMKKNLNAAMPCNLRALVRQEAELMIECALSDETRRATEGFFSEKTKNSDA